MSLPREAKEEETIEQAANIAGLDAGQFAEAYGDYGDHFMPEPPPK